MKIPHKQIEGKVRTIVTNAVSPGMSPYSVTEDDDILYVDTSFGDIIINLLPAAQATKTLNIKDSQGLCLVPGKSITVVPSSGESIENLDGSTGYVPNAPLVFNVAFLNVTLDPNPNVTGYSLL